MRGIVVSGYKDRGKTTLVEGIVKKLTERGYSVGTLKHVPHGSLNFGDRKADTERHVKAGSDETVALGSERVFTSERREAELSEVLREMRHLDFVVGEGFKNSKNVPRIIIAEDKSEAAELEDEFTVAFVRNGVGEKPVFEENELTEIGSLVEEKAVMPTGGLDCGECGYSSCEEYVLSAISGEASKEGCVTSQGEVSLIVDGKRVPLKPFIQDLVERTITGMVSSLKDTEGRKIEVKINKDEG